MSSLCPHQFQEYLKKVADILETYKLQIVLIKYEDISEGLLNQKVLKKREHIDIIKIKDGKEQMDKVLEILKKRMWGFEMFMTTLIDGHKNPWLSEELFQAYVRHLVVHMNKLKTEKICECFNGENNSIIYRSWQRALESFDGYLYEIGTSLGFLTQSMHPANSLLDFVRKKLPISRQKIITLTQPDLESSDSSEDDGDIKVPSNSSGIQSNTSNLPGTSTGLLKTKPHRPRRQLNTSSQDGVFPTSSNVSTSLKTPKPGVQLRTSLSTSRPKSTILKKSTSSKPPLLPRNKISTNLNNTSTSENESNVKSTRTVKTIKQLNVPVPVKRTNPLLAETNEPISTSFYEISTQTSLLDSISLSTSSDEEIILQDKSLFSSDEADNLEDIIGLEWDDEAFLPSPVQFSPAADVVSENNFSSTFSNESESLPNIRKIRINGSIRTVGNPASVSVKTTNGSNPTLTQIDAEIEQINSVSPVQTELEIIPLNVVALNVLTETICTQTDLPEPEDPLKLEPIKQILDSNTVYTQTTPDNSPKLNKRSNSYPGGLSQLPEKTDFLSTPKVFRSYEVQKIGVISSIIPSSGKLIKSIIVDSTDESNEHDVSEDSSPIVEVKPFLRKNSGKRSMVKKISDVISSATSSLKSSNSEKKILRTMSTSSNAKKNTSKPSPLKSTSISTSTSTMPVVSVSLADKSSTLNEKKSYSIQNKDNALIPNKSNTLPKSVTATKPINHKTPDIPLRQRVQTEIKQKKANLTPSPPPPINEERLAPKDYNFQQLSNAWITKQSNDSEQIQIQNQNKNNHNNNNNI